MRTIARWGFVAAAALLFVSSTGATVMVVDVDGTSYSVEVVDAPGGGSEDATALELTLTTASGTQTSLIAPTQDPESDHDPFLMLVPDSPGPVLIWSRRNGNFDQIAFSKFENQQWSPVQYLSNSARHHVRPQAGVDAFGTGYIIWVETGGGVTVMMATFDPETGNLLSSPRDLFRELVRTSPSRRLLPPRAPSPTGLARGNGRAGSRSGDISPDGGWDGPFIPPGAGTDGLLISSPNCQRAIAAVEKNRSLWIGVMQHGTMQQYYRTTIPEGVEDNYLSMFLQALLEQNCN